MAIDSAKLRTKIEAIESLPTLPTVVSKILEATRNPKADANMIGKILMQDAALCSKILKLVNSSFYGFPGKIKTITHAIVILGFGKVTNIAIATSVFDMSKKAASDEFQVGAFWEHSLCTAIVARVLAKKKKAGDPEEFFIGGLLHDLGKMIMYEFIPQLSAKVYEIRTQKDCLIIESEMAIMGFTHARIGEWIGAKWKLPDAIQNAIRYHHSPDKIKASQDIVYAAHLGDIIARLMGVGSGGDDRLPPISATVWKAWKLSPDFIRDVVDEVKVELVKAKPFFDLIPK